MTGQWPNFAGVRAGLVGDAPELARELTELIRPHAPVAKPAEGQKRKPGTLRDSLQGRVGASLGGVTLEVVSDDEVARYVIEGTAAHVIRPIRAKALRFTTEGGGVVFAREVHHPGTEANDFGAAAQPEISAWVRTSVKPRIAGWLGS